MNPRFESLQDTWHQSSKLWLSTNVLGSGIWALISVALTSDGGLGFICGLFAAPTSLIAIPLMIPLLNRASYYTSSKYRRIAAFTAVVFLFLLIVLSLSALIGFSYFPAVALFACPYLVAAIISVVMVYRQMLIVADSTKNTIDT